MEEPILKKKSMINKIFKNQLLLTMSTAFLLIFVVVGSSYAIFNSKTETGLNEVVVESGNLLATISSPGETIEMNYTTLGVSDEIGLTYEPYTFTVTNNGENVIKYYELRIVDKEHELSNLPHKSINYVLSKNGEDYTEPQNLGDNRSYIYVGGSLEPGESDTFNLKLWVNEEFGKYANNKEISASIELTLYSDIPTRNYINYDTQGGSYIPKTSTASKRVTNQIPLKGGYSFVGWSTVPNGDVEYESNAIYDGNNGITLYAVWKSTSLYETLETALSSYLVHDENGRFIVGTPEEITNNYVKYSGKLWRVVSLNDDGNIKVVTQDAVTNMENDVYIGEESSLLTWLNSEFLLTIDDNFLVTSDWDYTEDNEADTIKPETTDTFFGKVGMLTIYEYMVTGGKNGYLNNFTSWWTISPAGFTSGIVGLYIHNIWLVDADGTPLDAWEGEDNIRPSVVLNKNVKIGDIDGDGNPGNGTIDSPYEVVI